MENSHRSFPARRAVTRGMLVLGPILMTAAVLGPATTAQAAPAGDAPQCIHTRAWDKGIWSYQEATNTCGQAYRIELRWAVASSHCSTLYPGESIIWYVFRPAWAKGAFLC